MPRKKIRDRNKKSSNRIQVLTSKMTGVEKPETVMNELMMVLRETELNIPRPGIFVTFIYYAQRESLLYDRYPIVAVEGVFDWGFKGVNLHLGEPRNYNFTAAASPYYEIKREELDDALGLPLMRLYQNR